MKAKNAIKLYHFIPVGMLVFTLILAGCEPDFSNRNDPLNNRTALLDSLSVSVGALSPAFDENTTSYTVTLDRDVTGIALTPVVLEQYATVTVNGTAVASGTSSGTLSLPSVGANIVNVVVTAPDGKSRLTYEINAYRTPNTVSGLTGLSFSSGTLNPVFDTATTEYCSSVSNGTVYVTVTPTAEDPFSTIRVNGVVVASGTASGSIDLTEGINAITVTVTAEDTVTETAYTVSALRAITLHATGQTLCYDASGNTVSCTGTGQDGDLQIGAAWPDPRFTDNPDGTITDNLTGLMWIQDADLDGTTRGWEAWLDYIAGINLGTHENYGYTDWRMPNRVEMYSLLNYGYNGDAYYAQYLLDQGFVSVQYTSVYYTTASTCPAGIIVQPFYTGRLNVNSTDTYSMVVRSSGGGIVMLPGSGQTVSEYSNDDADSNAGVDWTSMPRFVDNGNGTVTDRLTGLMWATDANLADSLNNPDADGLGALSWQAALNFVAAINAGSYTNYGYTDWRMPNIVELASLLDAGRSSPAIQEGHPFVNVVYTETGDMYWSSTTCARFHEEAMGILFQQGRVYSALKTNQSYSYFIPVRGPVD